jgi:hypothetical protein
MRGPDYVHVPALEPGGEAEISVDLTTPTEVKTYAGSWRLCHREGGGGAYFGDEIWVVITVAEGGLLSTLQGIHGTTLGGQGTDGACEGLSSVLDVVCVWVGGWVGGWVCVCVCV